MVFPSTKFKEILKVMNEIVFKLFLRLCNCFEVKKLPSVFGNFSKPTAFIFPEFF